MSSSPPADPIPGTWQSPAPALPENACDAHVHVFGPADRYPYAPTRSYLPPDALPADLDALHRRLGIKRTVLVQPSPYATDNTRLLDGLQALGESARGVAVIAADADPGELHDMHQARVRGVRVNLGVNTSNDLEQARERIRGTVRRIAALGWHLDLHIDATTLVALRGLLAELPVPVVLDHFGGIRPAADAYAEALKTMQMLLETGHVWVKLSAPYRVISSGSYTDLEPMVTTLVKTRADRALWGSDWPHTGGTPADRDPHRTQPFLTVDDSLSLTRFTLQLSTPQLRQVLVDNPATLYGF